jgi:hypothetical protein
MDNYSAALFPLPGAHRQYASPVFGAIKFCIACCAFGLPGLRFEQWFKF